MSTHLHSRLAHAENKEALVFNRREKLILDFAHTHHTCFWTDRQIAQSLGFSDMNSVRPRITRLLEVKALVEGPSVLCEVTKKTVRTTAIRRSVTDHPAQTQLELSA